MRSWRHSSLRSLVVSVPYITLLSLAGSEASNTFPVEDLDTLCYRGKNNLVILTDSDKFFVVDWYFEYEGVYLCMRFKYLNFCHILTKSLFVNLILSYLSIPCVYVCIREPYTLFTVLFGRLLHTCWIYLLQLFYQMINLC